MLPVRSMVLGAGGFLLSSLVAAGCEDSTTHVARDVGRTDARTTDSQTPPPDASPPPVSSVGL